MKNTIRSICLLTSLVSLIAHGQNEWRDKWREMDYATVNGVELAYEDVGEGEVMLFIHGGRGTPDAFRPLLNQPALAGYRKILYHQRGEGQSGDFGPWRNGYDVMDALDLLDYLEIEAAHIVAHSWGGGTAGYLAGMEPDRVLSLVLLEPGVYRPRAEGLDPQNDLGERYRELSREVRARRDLAGSREESRTIDEEIDSSMRSLGGGPDGEERLTALYPDLRAHMRRFTEQRQQNLGVLPSEWPPAISLADFRSLSLPVLWVWSEQPAVRNQLDYLYWRELFPEIEETTVQGVGHALQMLKPAEVAELISEFYVEHPIE